MLLSRMTNEMNHPPIHFYGHALQNVTKHKHLDLTICPDLRWSDHITEICAKSSKLINIIQQKLKFTLDRSTLETIFTSFVRPILEYGSPVWNSCTVFDEEKLENIQLNTARIITGAMYGTSTAKLYKETGWITLAKGREISNLALMYKIVKDKMARLIFYVNNRRIRSSE